MDNKFTNYLYVILATLGYSLITVIIKLATNGGLDGLYFLGLGFMLSALIFWIMVFIKKENISSITMPLIICTAATILLFYFQIQAMKNVSVSLFNIVYFSYPIFVVILARILFRQKVSIYKIIALCISILGLILAIGIFETSVSFNITGVLFSLVCAIMNAISFTSQQQLFKRVTYNAGLAFIFSGISVFILLFYALSGGHFVLLSNNEILLTIAFAVIGTVLPAVFMAIGIMKIGASKASIINLFQPVITLTMAKLMFNDTMSYMQMAGCVIVILGIGFMSLERNKAKPA